MSTPLRIAKHNVAGILITFRTVGSYTFTAGATSTDVRLLGGGGTGGGASALNGGGGGGGGGFGRTPNLSTEIGSTYTITIGDTGADTTFDASVAGRGGSIGGTASGLGTGAGGAGGGGTGTTTVSGNTGNNGSAGSGGTGGAGAPTGVNPTGGAGGSAQTNGTTPSGGGGGQSTVLGTAGQGAKGIAVIAYDTGTPTITHIPTMSRLLVIYRNINLSLSHTAIFSRLVTVKRLFASLITLESLAPKQVQLPRGSLVSSNAEKTDKLISLPRLASISHTPLIRKALVLAAKMAQIAHAPIFARRVTVRRAFSATTSHIKKCFTYLEARLIPKGEGGITVVRKTTILLSDD